MVLKGEMQSQETESSNFYSSPLVEAGEDVQSGKFEAFLSHHSVWGCQDFFYTTVQGSGDDFPGRFVVRGFLEAMCFRAPWC